MFYQTSIPFVKTSQSFGAWSCMRYSRPLDLIFHHPLKCINPLTTRLVQQLLDIRHAVGLSSEYPTKHKLHAGHQKGRKMPFFVHGDLDLQTRLSKGPNMYSTWIWCISVHLFPRCFMHKQKKTTDWRCQKQNLPQFTACGNWLYIYDQLPYSLLFAICIETLLECCTAVTLVMACNWQLPSVT